MKLELSPILGLTVDTSPSARRAWIEIISSTSASGVLTSPSARRAWIEIASCCHYPNTAASPSARRAWIEITIKPDYPGNHHVALREEGVD